jgi:hypothetical protein
VALIAALAMVAVPGSVGSRVPSPIAAADPDLFQPVEVLSLTRGTTMTVQPPDPGARSAGNLDLRSVFIEPATRPEPPAAPVRDAQPAPKAGAVVIELPKPTAQPTAAPKRQAASTPSKPRTTSSAARVTTTKSTGGWRFDGNVSWYGPGFYGNRTACGQTLTRGLIGVAHKTLPCGTKIVFRNPSNGKTVTAAVVDRGPYVAGRQWDLTGGLCLALDHCFTGSIQWKFG